MTDRRQFNELLHVASKKFGNAGIASPEFEARLLLQEASSLDHASLISGAEKVASEETVTQFDSFVERRLSGEPVQRILGFWEFYGREFHLTEATLIPRPETELLVDGVIDRIAHQNDAVRVLDIGTGSGAIAVSIACELSCSIVIATDVSDLALNTARENAGRHGVSDRISFLNSDVFDKVEGTFDVIVSNPPYVRTNEITQLQSEVRDHDPHIALDGGPDGLRFYNRIIGACKSYLNPNGLLGFEVGVGQSTEIVNLLESIAVSKIEVGQDLSGIERMVFARI